MKPDERDSLLIRLDEKTANIYHLTEKQEAHLRKLNDSVAKNSERSSIALEKATGNSRVIGMIWKLTTGILLTSGAAGLGTHIAGLW